MNSAELARLGFIEWSPFNLKEEKAILSSLPIEPGVYVLRSPRPFGRYKGQSDIVYVGSAINRKGIRHRIRFYFHPGPTQKTSQRIRSKLDLIDDLQISCRPTTSSENPREIEDQILLTYERDHLELPPFNRQE